MFKQLCRFCVVAGMIAVCGPVFGDDVAADTPVAGDKAKVAIASKAYVLQITEAMRVQPDWAQTDSAAPDFIRNKPAIPSVDEVEYLKNKVTEIAADATDVQYPSAGAVSRALAQKASVSDSRFDTISTVRPTGTAPAGHVFIWLE